MKTRLLNNGDVDNMLLFCGVHNKLMTSETHTHTTGVAEALLLKSSLRCRCHQKVNIRCLPVASPDSLYLSSVTVGNFPIVCFHTESWYIYFLIPQVSGREEESKRMLICRICTVAGTGNASYHPTKQSKWKLLLCQKLWRGDRKIYWWECWWPAQSLNIFVAGTVTNREQLRVIWGTKISFHYCIYF